MPIIFSVITALSCLNFLFLGKDLLSALLVIESVWISLYFILAFVVIFTGVHTGGLLLPLILILAGVAVVLGFYYLYFI